MGPGVIKETMEDCHPFNASSNACYETCASESLVTELDCSLINETGLEKETIKAYVHKAGEGDEYVKYKTDFEDIGAVLVENEHHTEMFLETILLEGFSEGPIQIHCAPWVHFKFDNPIKMVFFTDKCYLPSETPRGLRRLRAEELSNLRGNGEEERKSFERIYDYDIYNDIGDPDKSLYLQRSPLGGKERPYPRRCRTGRQRSEADPSSEKRRRRFYVPRDECFSEVKRLTFSTKALRSVLLILVPSLGKIIQDKELSFPYFHDIDSLFSIELDLPPDENHELEKGILRTIMPRLVKTISGNGGHVLRFETPEAMNSAIEQKKLFMLDYHDILLPLVSRVRKLKGKTLYGSRTLFLLTPDGTLRPLAIELTRPPMDGKGQWKQVFSPSWHSTSVWLWRLAKAHVLAHDSGYHQLVSHWLRTHCVTEPYVIATNRNLVRCTPYIGYYTLIFVIPWRLMLWHERHLLVPVAQLRVHFHQEAYDLEWRFDMQALPVDLIRRGMAVEDPFAPHGVRLTIKDYPFANDGLLLWDIIKLWVTDYVNHYFPEPSLVEYDEELQAWWTEIRTVGHADKKDEPWWPILETPKNLIEILTIIIWVTSGHHAAVNFGQYAYGGYFPNRPTIARTKIPTEDPSEEDWEKFMAKPEKALLKCFPSQLQATRVMAVLDILSTHSPDEEYIGEKMEPSWAENPVIKVAFERFSDRLKKLEGLIDERNQNTKLKNRNGAGIVPYELLKPFSKPGVTGMGVPCSISI